VRYIDRVLPRNVIDTYRAVKGILGKYDYIIFSSMKEVYERFEEPIDLSQYNQKHEEIERIFEFDASTNGIDLAFQLFEKIWCYIKSNRVSGISNTQLLDSMNVKTKDEDVVIHLIEEGRWGIGTDVFLSGYDSKEKISLDITDTVYGDIVPDYVVEYIMSATHAFKRRMYTVAVSLLSIAVEAKLRDILAPRGYIFNGGKVTNVDIYKYTTANVGVNGNSYTVTFQDSLPKNLTDFQQNTNFNSTVEIKIRRYFNRNKGRTDLYIIAPQDFIDHWSSDVIDTYGQKTVGGLGQALDILRNALGILTPADLPREFDEVFMAIRNNLIHLSGESLNKEIEGLNISLRDFLNDDNKVFNLVTRIPYFINEQYIRLKTQSFSQL
jgi:hypothetical protein